MLWNAVKWGSYRGRQWLSGTATQRLVPSPDELDLGHRAPMTRTPWAMRFCLNAGSWSETLLSVERCRHWTKDYKGLSAISED